MRLGEECVGAGGMKCEECLAVRMMHGWMPLYTGRDEMEGYNVWVFMRYEG